MLIFGNTLTDLLRRCSLKRRIIIAAVAIGAPIGLLSAVAGEAGAKSPRAEAPETEAAAKAPGAKGGYQLRCWQFGRLIFEENNLSVPGEASAYALRMTDRSRSPVLLAETENATCLIKAGVEPAKPAARPY
jgi:hypothetical protein